MKYAKRIVYVVGGALLLLVAALFFVPKHDELRVLYATGGDSFDTSAYENFRQTLAANADIRKLVLDGLSLKRLSGYDAIYLDVGLQHTEALQKAQSKLIDYVRRGGHLFLENGFAADFPADLFGASAIVDVPVKQFDQAPAFAYPEVPLNLRGMQQVFQLFTDNLLKHGLDVPGFQWDKGIVPALSGTAQTLVTINGVPAMVANSVGKGTVVLASAFLPNRYFITGADLTSGMDAAAGFANYARKYEAANAVAAMRPDQPGNGGPYFNFKQPAKLEPFFSFAYAAANYQLRSAYLAYVSKERFGYSVTKTLGPYGRPAMAFENHFEALPAFQGREGIQWAELLKSYNMLPSFSLVRASYDWGHWQESVIVHLNTGTSAQPKFVGDYANSFYGSGAHLSAGGKFALLAKYPDYRELAGRIELPYRVYPALADLNGDGRVDLLAGSADGNVYAMLGQGSRPDAYANQPLPDGLAAPDAFGAPQKLALPEGAIAGGYAAIAVVDVSGDGKPDLLLGDAAGNVRLARGRGGLAFAAPDPLLAGGVPLRVPAYAAPAIGDVDGDGVPDLAVGDGSGAVRLYRGSRAADGALTFAAGVVVAQTGASFAAPSIHDANGDGKPDLAIGTGDGDVQLFARQPDANPFDPAGWKKSGSLEGETTNQVGTHTLVGGHNAVPLWYDINHDGKDDLIVGQLEFGPAYPVDDPAFPYADGLREFLQYSRDNKLELVPHTFVTGYRSAAQEKQELALQKKAFDALGIPWTDTGTNQHTWRINNADRLQTLASENEANIWYNFGFRPSHAPTDPPWGQGYMWGMPFLLQNAQLKEPMLIYTPGPPMDNARTNADIYDAFVQLDMPIDYFEHIEYHFPARVNELKQFVDYFDKLRTAHDYNFMSEPQMARSFVTAFTARVTVGQSWGSYLIDRVKDLIGHGEHVTLTVKPQLSAVPRQAGAYRDTLGVAIEPGSRYSGHPFATDADIYTRKGETLYTALQKPTRVQISWNDAPMHVIRANVPVSIDKHGEQWTIALNDDGMQQIKLYSAKPVKVTGTDLKIDEDAEAHTVTITHYGARTSVTVEPK